MAKFEGIGFYKRALDEDRVSRMTTVTTIPVLLKKGESQLGPL